MDEACNQGCMSDAQLLARAVQDWKGKVATGDDKPETPDELLSACLRSSGVSDDLSQAAMSLLTTALCISQPGHSYGTSVPVASLAGYPQDRSSAPRGSSLASSSEAQLPSSSFEEFSYNRPASSETICEVMDAMKANSSLYDRIGGWEALGAAVNCMYERMSNDPRTSPLLEGHDRENLMHSMTCFLGSAMCGAMHMDPYDIWKLHRPMMRDHGLSPVHVDIMCDHLKQTLEEIGAQQDTAQIAVGVLQDLKWIFNSPDVFQHPSQNGDKQGPADGMARDSGQQPTPRCHISSHGACPFLSM